MIFLSDNGAEGGNPLDFYGQPGFDWAEGRFDVGLENLGRPGSYSWLGAGWAYVGSTPLRYFKGFPTEGGIRTPAIFSFPGRIEAGAWCRPRLQTSWTCRLPCWIMPAPSIRGLPTTASPCLP